jgi:CHAT domain-containing protein/tetratricopeptide (TPR) repeat protein
LEDYAMPVDIVVPHIDTALGSSVIYEEYKGDYERARQLAEQRLSEARGQSDRAQLADALLARGIVHLLQGELAAALDYFSEVEHVTPDDDVRRLRALVYSYLATTWRFNLFPSRSGAQGIEIQSRWDGVAYATLQDQRWTELASKVADPAAILEARLVYNLLAPLHASRSLVEDAGNRVRAIDDRMEQVVLSAPANFWTRANEVGAQPGLLAYTTWAIADLQHRLGKIEPAQTFLQTAHATYGQGGDAAGAAMCQMTWGDWLAAPFSTPAVWNLAIRASSSEGSFLAWTMEAREFSGDGIDADGAASAYDEAERLFRQASTPRGVAALRLRRGYLATLTGDYQAAADHVLQAQQGFQDSGDHLGYWTARAHYALARIGAGQFPEPREIASEIGVWGATSGSFSFALGLGILFGRAGRRWLVRDGDYERSIACYRLALSLYEALHATTNVAQSLTDQGMVYKAIGERTMALTLYERALASYERDIAAQPGSVELVTRSIMLALGLYNLYLQDMDADGMERSAGHLQRLGNHLPGGSGSTLELLGAGASLVSSAVRGGLSNLSLEGMDEAVAASMAWTLSRVVRSYVEQARVMVPLYRAYRAREVGDEGTAAALFIRALEMARRASPGQRDFLEASVHGQQENYDAAVVAFNRYLAAGGANAGLVGKLSRFLSLAAGEAGRAEARKQQERTHDQAFLMMVSCKAYQDAETHLAELEQLAGEDWWTRQDRPWESLSTIAEMHEGLGRLEEASEYYDRAIIEFEARRGRLSRIELRTAMAAEKGTQYLYFLAARTALKLHTSVTQSCDQHQARIDGAKAFSYAERGKARALLDLMAGSVALASSSKTESEHMRDWRQVTTRLTIWAGLLAHERSQRDPDPERMAYLSQHIDADEAEIRRVETQLAATDPGFYRAVTPQATVMSLDEVRSQLPPGTALLQYYHVGKDLLAWSVTEQGMVQSHQKTVDASALERQMRAFQRACEAQGAVDELGEQLAAMLLAPLADTIHENQRLIIVPYGAGHSFPFHVLPWEGQPLIATHVVSYLPSASALQFLPRAQNVLSERILAVGNPARMSYSPEFGARREDAPPLPAAATEAAYVASLFNQGEALLGESATEAAVTSRLGTYPLVHFATHGRLSEEAPLLSSVLLADHEELTVFDLMGQQLNADLVVLSACNTARGETTRGDDVLGLTRGLLGAGARAAVVSLWPVNDVSTSLLMGEFYRRLQDGSMPAAALQAAQNYLRTLTPSQIDEELAALRARMERSGAGAAALDPVNDAHASRHAGPAARPTTSRDYSHPHYWAPFVLVG